MADTPRGLQAPLETVVLLAVASLLYAAMMGCLVASPGGDAIGRSVALLYTAFLGLVLWFVLAALLLVAAVKRLMPVWAVIGAVILLPLSYMALWLAGDAYGRGD